MSAEEIGHERPMRRDGYLVGFVVEVVFDSDLRHSRYDHVGTEARCAVCGVRVRWSRSAETLVEHSRSHERELSVEP